MEGRRPPARIRAGGAYGSPSGAGGGAGPARQGARRPESRPPPQLVTSGQPDFAGSMKASLPGIVAFTV